MQCISFFQIGCYCNEWWSWQHTYSLWVNFVSHCLCKENIDIEFLKVQQQITAHLILRVRKKMESGHVTMVILIALHCFSVRHDQGFFSCPGSSFQLPSIFCCLAVSCLPSFHVFSNCQAHRSSQVHRERGSKERERERKRSKTEKCAYIGFRHNKIKLHLLIQCIK